MLISVETKKTHQEMEIQHVAEGMGMLTYAEVGQFANMLHFAGRALELSMCGEEDQDSAIIKIVS